MAVSSLVLCAELSDGQTSELYMLYSPNVIYPVGTTSVYQGGHLLRSWTDANPYELSLAVVGGSVRQDAEETGFLGSEYTLAGVRTGTHYFVAPHTYDAASDGSSIYGWDLVTATLNRYDLNWNFQQSLFSLGSSYSYAFMGITYDPQNNSIWLSPWSTGSFNSKGNLYDYSLDGHLLSTLKLADSLAAGAGLAYDPADNTLWFFDWTDQRYEQYSKNGNLLGTMTGMTRIYGAEFMTVPEPSELGLLGTATLLILMRNPRSAGTSRCRGGAVQLESVRGLKGVAHQGGCQHAQAGS